MHSPNQIWNGKATSNMPRLRGTGVLSAIVMAWGTAITTGVIACFAVKSKDIFSALIPSKKPLKLIQFFGGSFIALFGYLLLTTERYTSFIEI
jgi:ABC-type nickel/cobalt efflux system permease component RcnA